MRRAIGIGIIAALVVAGSTSGRPPTPMSVPDASEFRSVVIPSPEPHERLGQPGKGRVGEADSEPTSTPVAVHLEANPSGSGATGGSIPPRPAATGHSLRGQATWYGYVPGGAAAGPRLRAALGQHWRGRSVSVCSGSNCVRVKLSDWCACGVGDRVIDLDARSFAKLAKLGRGVIRVSVRW